MDILYSFNDIHMVTTICRIVLSETYILLSHERGIYKVMPSQTNREDYARVSFFDLLLRNIDFQMSIVCLCLRARTYLVHFLNFTIFLIILLGVFLIYL